MKLVINISDEVYNELNKEQRLPKTDVEYLVIHGTPLPKGHGRLGDLDELLHAMDSWDKFGVDSNGKLVSYDDCYVPYVRYEDMVKAVRGMPTVIETNKKEGEKNG